MHDSNHPAAGADRRHEKAAGIWSGRFRETTDALVERFTASVAFDRRLAEVDIRGSIAHVTMLGEQRLLTATEVREIIRGLQDILADIRAGRFEWRDALEDVHMNIEQALTRKIGEAGKKLHTGRSRNDQVATDLRLYLRDAIDQLDGRMRELQAVLARLALRHAGVILPGFTHLQVAQPITFGHHLLAWAEMLTRDRARLADCRRRVDVMPLGSAALAGTGYPIARRRTAELLGFSEVSRNSLDAVSDRDFVIEFGGAASICMMHLSRWCEELILWSSPAFDFIRLPDRFCTGSSIMPQKKNPDVAELIRGKSGRVFGQLMSSLALMKSQPLAYNRDNQEDKQGLFDTIDTLDDCLAALIAMLPALEVQEAAMLAAARKGFATATDLADYLVQKGMPFRDAHAVVGRLVALAMEKGLDLAELPLAELQAASRLIGEDVFACLSLEGSVNARRHPGGTAPEQVLLQARALLERLGETETSA